MKTKKDGIGSGLEEMRRRSREQRVVTGEALKGLAGRDYELASRNLPGIGKGRILAGAAMDAHNTFAAPNTVRPVSYSGSSDNGKASFDLPGGSVAVVAVETQ